MTSRGAIGLVLCGGLLAAAPAGAAGKIGVGLFAPEVPFSGPTQRYSFVKGIAQHLAAALGTPVEGFAYKSAGDFERDLKNHKIQLAVVGSVYAATARGVKLLATARLQSGAAAQWSILCPTKASLESLRGKVLQVPSMGPLTINLVQNGLLGGNVELKRHFRVDMSPDVTSAATAVRLHRADAVVAPIDTKGLTPLVGAIRVPGPAFALLDRNLPAEVVTKATRAILSYSAVVANVSGWQAVDQAGYASLTRAARKRTYQMAIATAPTHMSHADIVDTAALKAQLPALEDLYWLP